MGIEKEKKKFDEELRERGYTVKKVENMEPIKEVKNKIANWLRDRYKTTGSDDEVLNKIHIIGKFEKDSDANKLTLECIQHLTSTISFDREIYKSSISYFTHLFGQDIHSQKGNNIVIQHPNSDRVAELHIDAPPTSKFEIVSWLPLVDCYSTKSFYILPLKESEQMMSDYQSNKFSEWEEFKELCVEKCVSIEANYGEILFFSSTLLHGSGINRTKETRWCLNARYKSLFAPTGLHDPMSFYNVLSTSALTDIALENSN